MQGKNPIRPPAEGDGQRLEVKAIFPTLQGEGPYAGEPAVFVRLGGCNLACAFCDTDFEEFAAMPAAEIIRQVKALAAGVRRLVVITGGEPFRQNIAPLCEALLEAGFKVQIETNGTLWRELPQAVEIVCSPKNTGGGYRRLRGDLLPRVKALKFIVSRHNAEYDHVGEVGQGTYPIPVYVQPMDEYDAARNADNAALALELAQRHGYRLSLQLHKMLGIA
ncbi:MAG: 7-carboxy-7-deazaguanine synthase QueE [Pseudomonadota bacterium]|nr:7-carboxy-7-deazaguanine synthase QueE [Pseudomonadota bacterium]